MYFLDLSLAKWRLYSLVGILTTFKSSRKAVWDVIRENHDLREGLSDMLNTA
jgi:hypothetical protein